MGLGEYKKNYSTRIIGSEVMGEQMLRKIPE